MMEVYFGTKLINHIFIILTLIKRYYIVMEFVAFRSNIKKGIKIGYLTNFFYPHTIHVIYFINGRIMLQ